MSLAPGTAAPRCCPGPRFPGVLCGPPCAHRHCGGPRGLSRATCAALRAVCAGPRVGRLAEVFGALRGPCPGRGGGGGAACGRWWDLYEGAAGSVRGATGQIAGSVRSAAGICVGRLWGSVSRSVRVLTGWPRGSVRVLTGWLWDLCGMLRGCVRAAAGSVWGSVSGSVRAAAGSAWPGVQSARDSPQRVRQRPVRSREVPASSLAARVSGAVRPVPPGARESLAYGGTSPASLACPGRKSVVSHFLVLHTSTYMVLPAGFPLFGQMYFFFFLHWFCVWELSASPSACHPRFFVWGSHTPPHPLIETPVRGPWCRLG